MANELFKILIGIPFMVFLAFLLIAPIVRIIYTSLQSEKTVKATVVEKHISEHVSKYAGTGKPKQCMVVFSIDGKRKGFQVSEFSYDGYKVNDTGMLTYKGNRLIKFE